MKDIFVDRFLKCTSSQGVVRLDFGRVESIDNDNNDKLKIEYNLKTLKELKDIAKSKELKNISKTNKAELIEMLIKI